ncbi:diguanylate cyclase (GGDEF)-like protein [Clostridium saccharobutylicum]|uniref:diguanylate cyclase n=1 Tax=Clostridium saccharobutylicum TaxID=169679 RepID=UPI0015704F1E|nr:diguanylate cyclase (GGDEF)-like protein [Clostridium saccharobutylicum]
MKKRFIVKIYLILSIFTVLIPTSSIILAQQKIIPSFDRWRINNFTFFLLVTLSISIIPTLFLVNKITRIYVKIKEIKNNLNMKNEKKLNKFKLKNIDFFFEEIDKISREARILQFENRILYDTALAIHSTASFQELLDTILARLTTHINADFGLIFLLENDELRLKAYSNIFDQDIEKTSFRIGEGLVGWCVHKGEGILTRDVQNDYRYIRCINYTKAQITIPIKMYERILGVLVLGSKKSSNFNESDFKLINTISGEIGLAINNAQLTEHLKKENENNQMLFKLTKKITSSVELNKVAEIGVKTIIGVINVKSCVLAILEEGNEDVLKIISSYGTDKEKSQFLESKEAIREAFTEKRSVEQKIDTGYVYSIPILSKENCIGILHINTENILTIEEIELINSAVASLSSALENAFLYKSVETLAIRDGLTSTYNRRYFQDVIDEYTKKAQINNEDLSLVMLDVDNFKKYNDTYGHIVGDFILKKIANIMENSLRHDDIISRYGGDEFIIILPNTKIEEAKIIMENIRDSISSYKFEIDDEKKEVEEEKVAELKEVIEVEGKKGNMFKGENLFNNNFKNWIIEKVGLNQFNRTSQSFNVTISVGISSLMHTNYDKEMLIKNADKSSLESKRKGKNQVSICMPELN